MPDKRYVLLNFWINFTLINYKVSENIEIEQCFIFIVKFVFECGFSNRNIVWVFRNKRLISYILIQLFFSISSTSYTIIIRHSIGYEKEKRKIPIFLLYSTKHIFKNTTVKDNLKCQEQETLIIIIIFMMKFNTGSPFKISVQKTLSWTVIHIFFINHNFTLLGHS